MNSMIKNSPARIGEFLVPADVAHLNEGLAARGIGAEAVISVIAVAGTPVAGGPGDRFRVLYRAG